jgi:nucleotide-binding universal stress UspA family protein
MVKTIVIGYDDSEASRRALERGAALARAFASKLVVTSVAPVSASPARSLGADPTDTAADHLAELATARAYLEGEGLQADYIEALGNPGESILAAASERSADMIIVGTREPGVVQRLLGQSVSDTVSHHAHCDVLIVH